MNSEDLGSGGVGSAVQLIQETAKKASDLDVMTVDTEGLGDGLPDRVPFLYDRGGAGLVPLASVIENSRLEPDRRKGTAVMTSLSSLIAFINRQKDEDSVVFGNAEWPGASITCVFDYHTKAHTPRHLAHKAHYAFAFDRAFKTWMEADGQVLKQDEFAAFIEDMIADLASPSKEEEQEFEKLFKTKFATPSQMVSLSRGLQVNVASQVKNNVTLQSGEGEIVFVEEHRDAAGEKIVVPGLFIIALPIFEDGHKVRIAVRLRYRVSGGGVRWIMQMYKVHEAIVDRVRADLALVHKETGLSVFEGSPEDLNC